MITKTTITEDYWKIFRLEEPDLEFLYSHLLEIESPQTPQELLSALVSERIRAEKKRLQDQQKSSGKLYFPRDTFEKGERITFPLNDWQTGRVLDTRPSKNPELPPFTIMTVAMENGETLQFASDLEDHHLNTNNYDLTSEDPNMDQSWVMKNFGESMLKALNQELAQNIELVKIAGRWFPRSLLIDVNIGYLNMAEAVLDVEGGGPLTTKSILEQIEFPTNTNIKLTEFSLNHALQEDSRFDEVGPSGEILWYLRRYEPDYVKNLPPYLKFSPVEFPLTQPGEINDLLQGKIYDELEPDLAPKEQTDEISLSLLYPHWRAGTLPLAGNLNFILPTAYEAPRVRFLFIDKKQNKQFPGWIIRNEKYAFGLKEWYNTLELTPGSIVYLKRGAKPGEVIIRADTHRPTRDWIRTALVGADGGIVFAMLKQMIPASFDERMVIGIPDVLALDKAWEASNHARVSLEKTAIKIMRELSKLNPQGQVNFIEMYSAINIIRRCPPGPLMSLLMDRPWAKYLGDLYFRMDESIKEENVYA